MELSPELRAVHLDLSPSDLRFRERAAGDPELLSRETFRSLDGNREVLHYRIQSWPTFVGRRKLDEFRRVAIGVSDLVRAVPERVFGNDPERIDAFYGIGSAALTELFVSKPNGADQAVARGDFIDDGDAFKCLEFNFTPSLGGWESEILVAMHLAIPATARALEECGIRFTYSDTVRVFFHHMIEDVLARGIQPDGPLTVAIAIGRKDPLHKSRETADYLNGALARACEAWGGGLTGRVVVCPSEELVASREMLYCDKRRVHAVIELGEEPTAAAVARCFKAGKVALYNGPMTPILTSKQNIAVLSEHEASGVFSDDERAFIRRHLPWSRQLAAKEVELHDGERAWLPDLLAARRDDLVIKRVDSWGGKGVAIGRFTPQAEWDERVRDALEEGGWIVQQRVDSRPYLYQNGEHGCSPHDVIWGPFVFGRTYGGAILRMQPKADEGAVNLSLTATEGIVLEVEDSI